MEFIAKLKARAFGSLELPPDHVIDDQGWVHAKFQGVAVPLIESSRASPLTIIEVGSWKGKSACLMAEWCKSRGIQANIICVDTWLGAPEFWTWGLDDPTRGLSLRCCNGYPQVYHTFIHNVKAKGHDDCIAPLPLPSLQAAEVLTYYGIQADIIYIDGSHEYQAVRADLEAFWPLLTPNTGVMLGDDYDPCCWPGVQKAVDEFCDCNKDSVTKTLDHVVWSIAPTQK